MAATLATIRTALASALHACADGKQVAPYVMANPTPPALMVGLPTVEFNASMQRGYHQWRWEIHALAGSPEDKASQQRLDGWLETGATTSVYDALTSDPTLGSIIQPLVVESADTKPFALKNGTMVIGATFTISFLHAGH